MIEEEARLKEEQELKKFKEKVSEKIPGIAALQMDEEKWNKLRKILAIGRF